MASLARKFSTSPTPWSGPPVTDNPLIRSFSLWGQTEQLHYSYKAFGSRYVKGNGIVYAAVQTRQLVFSEASFQWQRKVNGRPQELFGSPELAILERPWAGGSTGDVLSRMEFDASIAGNSYWTLTDDAGNWGRAARGASRRMVRLAPDQVSILVHSRSGDPRAADAYVVAYMFTPSMSTPSPVVAADTVVLKPEDVAHYAPVPDPDQRWMGMSWIRPVLEEVEADKAATKHKGRFFKNGATPNMVVTVDKDTPSEDFNQFVESFSAGHEGADNAYKTLILSAGADAKVVGADLKQLDFKSTQGAGETRIAAASGVPAVILGISEGLSGSSLNAGNFASARRRFADGTLRPLWRMAAAALQNLLTVPEGAYLTYDPREIAFLREDRKDAAEIERIKASTIRQLTDAGYLPDDAVRAVDNEDSSLLIGKHSGLFSVQLLAANPDRDAKDEAAIQNTEAATIASLLSGFEAESVVSAVQSGDWSKLVEKETEPVPAPLAAAADDPPAQPGDEELDGSQESQG